MAESKVTHRTSAMEGQKHEPVQEPATTVSEQGAEEEKPNFFKELMIVLWVIIKTVTRAVYRSIVPAPEKSVEGQIVLITGAGSGIGRLMALEFSRRGAIIVSWDVNAAGNSETAQLIRDEGGEVHTYTVDVSDRVQVNRVGQQVTEEVGIVNILVNNAGIVSGTRILDTPDEKILKTFNVNALGHFWTVQTFLPAMKQRGHGHVVSIASIAGVTGGVAMTDYCATKFAVVGFTESLSLELGSEGHTDVHTTLCCPYHIDTGMFSGCVNRFPWLLSALDPEYTAKRIVRAVVTNQKVVYMPRLMYLMSAVKAILPAEAQMALHKFLGATTFMDTFVGRQEKQD